MNPTLVYFINKKSEWKYVSLLIHHLQITVQAKWEQDKTKLDYNVLAVLYKESSVCSGLVSFSNWDLFLWLRNIHIYVIGFSSEIIVIALFIFCFVVLCSQKKNNEMIIFCWMLCNTWFVLYLQSHPERNGDASYHYGIMGLKSRNRPRSLPFFIVVHRTPF